ncbi:collagen-like protein, partial [Lactiplantibacillus plantarum]|nr:collagen-like protein [Lactiplantibacillus plantarum]
TQVDNSAVGTNLLIGTATPVSVTGNNTVNQREATYYLCGGMNFYNLYQKYGSTFTLRYDWFVTDTASAYTGQMQQQFNNNPWTV